MLNNHSYFSVQSMRATTVFRLNYDASTFPLIASGPGYTQYETVSNGCVTETVNGVTINIGANYNPGGLDLFLAEPPYVTSGNVFDLEVANELPVNWVYGDNYTYQYVRLEWISAPFLNGLGNVQQFSAPSGTAGGVDLLESYTYDPSTGGYIPSVEQLPFIGSLDVTASPEPGIAPDAFARVSPAWEFFASVTAKRHSVRHADQ
jgi:hypothetical protein